MTPIQARDEMFTMLNTAWSTYALGVVGGTVLPEIRWQGNDYPLPPDPTKAFAKATVLHMSAGQTALSGRRWDRSGAFIIQCFGPISRKGLAIAEGLAKIALDSVEGQSSPGGIWFRHCRLMEIGASNSWEQINVVADFLYDEVK
jgi:hypothetical protein